MGLGFPLKNPHLLVPSFLGHFFEQKRIFPMHLFVQMIIANEDLTKPSILFKRFYMGKYFYTMDDGLHFIIEHF